MHSLDKRPGLNLCVRGLIVRCEKASGGGRQKRKDANVRANELMQRLPNLRSLSIQWDDNGRPFRLDYLRLTHHSNLRKVTFLGPRTSLDEVCSFMGVRGLASIVAKDLDPESKVSLQRKDSSFSDANLDLLDLSRVHLPPLELHNLLEHASRITALHCAMPGLEESIDPCRSGPSRSKWPRYFRPQE